LKSITIVAPDMSNSDPVTAGTYVLSPEGYPTGYPLSFGTSQEVDLTGTISGSKFYWDNPQTWEEQGFNSCETVYQAAFGFQFYGGSGITVFEVGDVAPDDLYVEFLFRVGEQDLSIVRTWSIAPGSSPTNYWVEETTPDVLPLTFEGFYQPVDMGGVYNKVKNGSTVPLKFNIYSGTTELKDVSSVNGLTFAETNCDTTAITDDIETTATGSTVLRYDTLAGQFVYNWKTPRISGKCYRVTVTAIDGVSLSAYFKLK